MQGNRTYGGVNEDWAFSLIQTSDGGYAVAGETCSFGAGTPDHPDAWLIKIDSQTIVSEFPPFLILPLCMIATLLAVIVCRRKHSLHAMSS